MFSLGNSDCVSPLGYGSGDVLFFFWKSLFRVRLFVTPWTVAHQAPPSMGFSRQEYWSGLPFPFPGDLSDAGIEHRSPALQADPLTSEPPGKPMEAGMYSSSFFCNCKVEVSEPRVFRRDSN